MFGTKVGVNHSPQNNCGSILKGKFGEFCLLNFVILGLCLVKLIKVVSIFSEGHWEAKLLFVIISIEFSVRGLTTREISKNSNRIKLDF